jgi:hypothetical protein
VISAVTQIKQRDHEMNTQNHTQNCLQAIADGLPVSEPGGGQGLVEAMHRKDGR